MHSILASFYTASTWIIPVLFAITLHEVAHGWVAYFFGDNTAKNARRLSLNPLRHIDRFGTIILPALLLIFKAGFIFGYAKPVPVNPHNLRQPKFQMIWVALAGPFCNVTQAFICALLLHIFVLSHNAVFTWAILNLKNAIMINALLAVFNMFPIPPMDGSRVIAGISPRPVYNMFNRLEPFGIFIVIAIFMISSWITTTFALAENPLYTLITTPSEQLIHLIMALAGHPQNV